MGLNFSFFLYKMGLKIVFNFIVFRELIDGVWERRILKKGLVKEFFVRLCWGFRDWVIEKIGISGD